jgi:hypothetical protein
MTVPFDIPAAPFQAQYTPPPPITPNYAAMQAPDAASAQAALNGAGPLFWIIYLAVMAVMLWPFAEILKRSGRSPWLVLLMFVPFVNLFVYFWMAFGRWPVLEQLRAYQSGMIAPGAHAHGYPSQGYAPLGYAQPGYGAQPVPPQQGGWGQS